MVYRGEACKLCLVDPVKLEDGVLTEAHSFRRVLIV